MARFINKEQGALIGPRDHLGDDNLFKFNALYSEIYYQHELAQRVKFLHKLYYDLFEMDFLFEMFPEDTVGINGGSYTNAALIRVKPRIRPWVIA